MLSILKKQPTNIFLVFVAIILSSCSSSKEFSVEDFAGHSEINKGEDAQIAWEFANADSVYFDKMKTRYNAADEQYMRPIATKTYPVKAFFNDTSFTFDWTVYVSPDSAPHDKEEIMLTHAEDDKKPTDETVDKEAVEETMVTAGGKIACSPKLSPSFYESDYLSGIIDYSKRIEPVQIKALRIEYPDDSHTDLKLRLAMLDDFGNFITGMSHTKKQSWSTLFYCKTGVDGETIGKPIEKHSTNKLAFSIAIENSAAAVNMMELVQGVADFIPNLNAEDKLSLSYFNQNHYPLFDFIAHDSSKHIVENLSLPSPNGFNAFNRSSFHALADFNNIDMNTTKVLVLFTFSSDNASILYKVEDVVKLAKKNNVIVYTVAIGNAVESYPLRYLSDVTGGKYYSITAGEFDQVKNLLTEISFIQNNYYEVSLPKKLLSDKNCVNVKSQIAYELEKGNLTDRFRVISKPEPQYPKYQALAAFYNRDTVVIDKFHPAIKSMAKSLTDTPDMAIELIGHSSIEGTEDFNLTISRKRAQAVRKILLNNNVESSQIRIRWEGNNKPVFYLQQSPWQQYYNRRVEVRWLDPALLPYELIAQTCESENVALSKVEEWELRGYNAYYERYLLQNVPVYRIKIWGYATLHEAEAAANKIEVIHNYRCKVQ